MANDRVNAIFMYALRIMSEYKHLEGDWPEGWEFIVISIFFISDLQESGVNRICQLTSPSLT